MKHCAYCGKDYSDEVDVCPTDGTHLQAIGTEAPAEKVQIQSISTDEQRFWERMTFKQFAVVIVRLQALWLLFAAVVDATYLPRYFPKAHVTFASQPLYSQLSLDAFLAILRIILHVAGAFALIQYAERVLGWLVKDSISKTHNSSKD